MTQTMVFFDEETKSLFREQSRQLEFQNLINVFKLGFIDRKTFISKAKSLGLYKEMGINEIDYVENQE